MHCSHGLPHGLSLVLKGVRAGRHRALNNDSEGNQNISTNIDMWSKPTDAYRSNTGSHKNRGAGCEVPLPFDMRFEVLLFNALEQAARACTRKTLVGRAPGSSGFQGAIGSRNRAR